ncbi:uncharacterized protein [Fopius arisanus]|uniref:Uncharacterized protein isoform X3 n=1 Tax=Fopius arisanus TaxID=64838 RepID=A0A9R1U8M2_9HYME|nr:PREDICTED: uncharacterized protein LOC105272529 isoform X3 [Fopius arisanus]
MTSSNIKYTSSKAIEHFNVGATLMRITGYVDCIEGLKELPKSASKWIYKCIVNNNDGKRVRILFWGDSALRYNKEIAMYQIIKISGGTIKLANPTYRRSGDTVSDKEFQFGCASTLEVLDVCTAREPVMITGWLKEPFRSISTTSGTSYGSGMICTDTHRMTVQVATFIPNEELREGMKLTVKGTIDRRLDAFVLNANSMDQIAVVPGAPMMSEDDMEDAVESPPLNPKREADFSESSDGKVFGIANYNNILKALTSIFLFSTTA